VYRARQTVSGYETLAIGLRHVYRHGAAVPFHAGFIESGVGSVSVDRNSC